MRYRSLSEIFPVWYPDIPSEEDMRMECQHRLAYAQRPEDMTDWIKREPCPYRQEAIAVVLHTLLSERCDEDEFRMASYVREEIETEIKRIIRRAFSDQIAEEMLHAEGVSERPSQPAVTSVRQTQRIDRLEQQVDYLWCEVEKLRTQRPENTLYCRYLIPNDVWSMEEMEQQLKEIIHSPATTLVAYLREREQKKFMQFYNESAVTIYNYLNNRYTLHYKLSNFQKAW